MAPQPFFTIVTPVYKGRDFIKGCAESVSAQGFGDYEHLLIDDGSPDESGALCDELAETDRRVRAIHQPNAGITGARNTGIRQARGRYLLFLDQDDRLAPCALEAIHSALAAAGEDLVSWRHHSRRDEMCRQAGETEFRRYSQSQLGRLYDTGTVHYVWTKAFPVDFLRRGALFFDESIQDGTDDLPFVLDFWRAWFTAHPQAGVRYCPQFLYYYECGNAASVSKRPQPLRGSHLEMFSRLLRDLSERYGVPDRDLGLACYIALHTLAYGVRSTPARARRALRRRLLGDGRFGYILEMTRRAKVYSPFYLPLCRGTLGLVAFLFRSYESPRRWWYWQCYRLGGLLLGPGWRQVF